MEPTQAETRVNRLKRWVLRGDSVGNEYFVGNFFISRQLTLPKTGDTPRKAVLCTMQEKLLQNWEKKSGERVKEYKKFLHRANKNKTLRQLPDLNEQAFEKIDCLQCANCCKNYSPRFTPPDIKRISKFLDMKEGDFKDTYLKEDEDGDNVTKTKPCPFLGADNYCSIYEVRPTDCVRFPYMDDDFMLKRQPLVLKNISFCPITYYVIEKLIEVEKGKSSGA